MAPSLAGRVWRDFPRVYLALLGAAFVFGLARWPIVAVDTDLWYHLAAGRWIASAHALPHAAFFSFLRPEVPWVDYYWGAQLLFYGVHAAGGYGALIALRAVLALGAFACVAASLRLGRAAGEGWGATAVVWTLVCLYLLPRFATVRPHDLSYLLVAAFALLLESRRWPWLWPALAVFWVNVHGIEFPVLELLVLAYLGEWALARAGALPAVRAPAHAAFLAAGTCVLAPLVTPNGLALLGAPLAPLSFASQYIEELKPYDFAKLFGLAADGLVVTRETLLTLVAAGGLVAAAASASRERLRPAHLLLFAGGALLLWRMQRFACEFVLLAVPLLAAFRPRIVWAPPLPRAAVAVAVLALAVLPFRHLASAVEWRCALPLCTRGLPAGTVTFLRQVGATGSILNHPNHGGYLEWEAYPRQRLFVDLQTPFLFPDTAIFAADQAFQDARVLASLVAEYHPAFLLVPKELRGFPALAARVPEYAPVFVDDAAVLYANGAAAPELVAQYRLSAVEPFTLQLLGGDADAPARAAAELARVNAIYPDGGRARVFEGALALGRGDVAGAQRIADDVIARHPERGEGFRLRGDALVKAQRLPEAADAYEAALARSEPGNGEASYYLNGRLWAVYSRLGLHKEAYASLKRALGDVYRASVGYEELASLAYAALDAGHEVEGRTLLEFALRKAPPEAAEVRARIEAKLRELPASR